MKKTGNPVTTCQICGRPILANTGVIAHHGYKRPDYGWQTQSCMGARHLPYEKSCDLIPVAIKAVNDFIARSHAGITSLTSNPPETLTYSKYQGAYKKPLLIEIPRPANFNPATAYHSGHAGDYSNLFFGKIRGIEAGIKAAQFDIEYLTERLAKWVAPEPKAEPEPSRVRPKSALAIARQLLPADNEWPAQPYKTLAARFEELESMSTASQRMIELQSLEPAVRDILAAMWGEKYPPNDCNSKPKTYENYNVKPQPHPFKAGEVLYYVFNGETPLYICEATPEAALRRAGVPQ